MNWYYVYREEFLTAKQLASAERYCIHSMIREPFVSQTFPYENPLNPTYFVCPAAPILDEEADDVYRLLFSFGEQPPLDRLVLFDLTDSDRVSPVVAGTRLFKASASARNGAFGLHYPIPHVWQRWVLHNQIPPINESRFVVAFQGALTTHSIRAALPDIIEGCRKSGFSAFYRELPMYFHSIPEEERGEYENYYPDSILGAKFVLCPRGHGLSSYRLYEALAAGRIPVIYSDELVLPMEHRLDWTEFSIRVPEADALFTAEYIARFLKTHDLTAASNIARRTWRRYFCRHGTGLKRLLDKALPSYFL